MDHRRQKGKRVAITSLLRTETFSPSKNAGEAVDAGNAEAPDELNRIDEEDPAFAGAEPQGTQRLTRLPFPPSITRP